MSATAKVDSRAAISERARLASGVQVGAYAVVGDDVELGENCVLHPHAVVRGPARYGRENIFHSFCSIGSDPQDLKYHGERTTL
jgi:UDP-N-acetylglucosamine acyltransferase